MLRCRPQSHRTALAHEFHEPHTARRAQAAVSHPEHVGWTGMCLTTCLRLDTEGGIQPRAARVSLSPRVKTHHRQHIQLHFTPDYALTKF